MEIKIILDPPWMFNPIEFKWDEDGKIEGWRSLGWKRPEEWDKYNNEDIS